MLERRSKLHTEVYKILKQIVPGIQIYEEYQIKIQNHILFVDIYLPAYKIAIEINGEQHYKFNKFFHLNKQAFSKQRFLDSIKQEFCDENDIKLVVIKYDFAATKESMTQLLKGE